MVRSIAPYDLLFVTQPPKLVPSTMFRAGSEIAEGARFISIDGAETCVIGFACTSGLGGGQRAKASNKAPHGQGICPSLYLTNSRLLYDQVNEQEMFGLVG